MGFAFIGRIAALASALVLSLAFADSASAADSADAQALREAVLRLGGKPCADNGELVCVTVRAPYDHLKDYIVGARNFDFELAVRYADGESRGIFVTVVGGPGDAGIASAQDYIDYYHEDLVTSFDLVFFNQRGTGPTYGFDCADVLAELGLAHPKAIAASPDEASKAARAFARRCTAMTNDLLPYLQTEQAIRDLEIFRQELGAEVKFWLYGVSYGTQFAQQYATAFPEAIAGLILDGVVDLTLDLDAYGWSLRRTVEPLLDRLFAECDALADCHADMGGQPAAEVYKRLAIALVKEDWITTSFPLSSGLMKDRDLIIPMLTGNAAASLYSPESRAEFLRALAAAGRGNYVPMLRLTYSNLGVDSETLEAWDDNWYGGAYYAITCLDYGDAADRGEAKPDEVVGSYVAAMTEEIPLPRLVDRYISDSAICAFWPEAGTAERPAPFIGGDYHTFVLVSDADPATPAEQGQAVYSRIENATLVTKEGGPHVIFGWGDDCPDQLVVDWLLSGTPPAQRDYSCATDFLENYVPLTLTDPAEADDPLALVYGLDDEIYQIPDFYSWDGESALAIGCDYGGSIAISSVGSYDRYRFRDCRFWPDLVVNGEMSERTAGSGALQSRYQISVDGAHQGEIDVLIDWGDGEEEISGTYDGRKIE